MQHCRIWLLVYQSASLCLAASNLRNKLPMTEGTDVRFAHISFGEEPSNSSIKGIIQDSQGFLWFGTQDGLKRYDGYRFRDCRKQEGNPNGLSGTAISAMFLDRSGILWVSSDWFLDRYDPVTERFAPVRTGSGGPMRFGGGINNINQDSAGIIWLSTTAGLFRLNPVTGNLTHYDHRPGDPASLSSDLVKSTFEEKDGTFWVATTEGLDVFDRRTARVTDRVPLNPPTGKAAMGTAIPRLRGDQPIKLMVDHAGVLWAIFPFGSGRFIVYRHSAEPGSLSNDWVNTVCIDHLGIVWAGTQGGLNRLDPATDKFLVYDERDGLPNSNLSGILEDNRGNL